VKVVVARFRAELEEHHTMASPTLETSRLILQSITPDDRNAIVAILSDPEAMEFMHYKSWNEEQRQGWVDTALEIAEQSNADSMAWVIKRKDSGETIGWFGIGKPVDPANTYDISFEYALGRPHWNQGYMTEVLRGIFAYEFGALGVPQLSANCHPENRGSSRVMEKAGMLYTRISHGPNVEGDWQDQHHYRITQDEWNALKKR
jgi:ribosomal-protein-alanine N-acetyltransferase